jgi:cyanophycinase-like exopeptidase
MKGYVIFSGGEAFSSTSKTLDSAWLKLVRGAHQPRVVILPTASTKNPGKDATAAVEYFKHLGTYAEYTLITDALTANTGQFYEILNKVEAICLTDGSPIDVVEALQGTHTESALRRAVMERKACVMGTGASAMALGGVYWLGSGWEPGLGITPHLAILPHHSITQMRFPPERLLADLPEGITLIGIDDATGVICHPDGIYQVAGRGEVTVYRSVDQQDVYRADDTFRLDI